MRTAIELSQVIISHTNVNKAGLSCSSHQRVRGPRNIKLVDCSSAGKSLKWLAPRARVLLASLKVVATLCGDGGTWHRQRSTSAGDAITSSLMKQKLTSIVLPPTRTFSDDSGLGLIPLPGAYRVERSPLWSRDVNIHLVRFPTK